MSWLPSGSLDLAEWLEHGRRLGVLGRSAGWWIGDWLNYGHARYGEKYTRAARVTGYDVQSLMNMAYVASRFEVSRRREKLSWSHHAEVAAMGETEQDHWLEEAEGERLSVRCLRDAVRRARRALPAPPDGHHPAAEADGQPSPPPEAAAGNQAHEIQMVCPECGFAFPTA